MTDRTRFGVSMCRRCTHVTVHVTDLDSCPVCDEPRPWSRPDFLIELGEQDWPVTP